MRVTVPPHGIRDLGRHNSIYHLELVIKQESQVDTALKNRDTSPQLPNLGIYQSQTGYALL